MNYRKAVEFIVTRRKDELLNASIYFEHLKNNPKLLKIETELREMVVRNIRLGITNSKEVDELQAQKDQLLQEIADLNKLYPKPHCSKCNDTGFVNGKYCECVVRQAIETENHITLPLHDFEECNLELFEPKIAEKMAKMYTKLKEYCVRFPNVKRNTILFLGNCGTGKTFLTSCICNELLKKQKSVVFMTSFEITRLCLDAHTDFDKKTDILNSLLDCDVLAIDDFGVESIYKNITIEYMYEIINERQISNKTTIITTNLTMDEISRRFGDRVSSRLFDVNNSYVKTFENNDLRKQKIGG